ncbi:MAG: ATP-binding protein [Patescibacteria group bacterium]
MNVYFIATLVLIVLETLIGLIVYLHDSKQRTNRLFLSLTLAIVLWTVANYLADVFSSHFWAETAYLGALLIFYTLFLFVEAFPQPTGIISKGVQLVLLALTALLGVIIYLPQGFIVAAVIPRSGGIDVQTGVLFPILASYFITLFSVVCIFLFQKLRHSESLERIQLQYLTFGLLAGLIIGIGGNLIIPLVSGDFLSSRYGPWGVIIFLLLTTFAIVRYNLLNITVIATEVFVVLLLLILLGQVFLADGDIQLAGNITVLVLASVLAYFLIRSMLREVKQRQILTRLTTQLEDANQQLKVLDEAKSEFVSIASHQLRTPLTVIKGYVSMLSEGSFGKIPNKQEDPIRKIYESANRLIELVENLLSISRIESGRMKYNMAPTKLEELAASATEELQTAAGNKKLKLVFEQPREALPVLPLDGEKLRQVMMNLIDNAVKYTPKGSVTVRVEVVRNKRPPYIAVPSIMFSVTDTGAGLAPEDQKRLFQKFNRADGNNLNTRGTGLGLYVGRMMVEAHHGVIWVTSPGVNKGSTFAFAVPLPSVTDEAILALKDMVR